MHSSCVVERICITGKPADGEEEDRFWRSVWKDGEKER